MSIEYYQSLLLSINSSDPIILSAAVMANQYVELCKSGKLSADALYKLLQEIQIQAAVDSDSIDVRSLEMLNTALTGLSILAAKVQ